jgi:hypothetical protein
MMHPLELKDHLAEIVRDQGIIRPLEALAKIALEFASGVVSEPTRKRWLAISGGLDEIVKDDRKAGA